MADRLSDRLSKSDPKDSDSDSEPKTVDPAFPGCWLTNEDALTTEELTEVLADAENTTPEEIEREASRLDQTRTAVVEVHHLNSGFDDRRLVVRKEDGVYNLYLQVKRIDENHVGRWERKRLLSAGNAENPLQ